MSEWKQQTDQGVGYFMTVSQPIIASYVKEIDAVKNNNAHTRKKHTIVNGQDKIHNGLKRMLILIGQY